MSRLNGRLTELERVLPPDGMTPLQRRRLERQRQAPPRNWDLLMPAELDRLEELTLKCELRPSGRWNFAALTNDELGEMAALIGKAEFSDADKKS